MITSISRSCSLSRSDSKDIERTMSTVIITLWPNSKGCQSNGSFVDIESKHFQFINIFRFKWQQFEGRY